MEFSRVSPAAPSRSGADAFVTMLNPSGSGLSYSTGLGGGGGEITASISRAAISVHSDGSAFVSGHTASSDFPTTSDALDRTYNGTGDAFLTRLNAAGMTAFMVLALPPILAAASRFHPLIP